jgi:hypothetical protein
MFEPNSALAPFNEPGVVLEISHWPQTWGWYCLLAVGFVWALVAVRVRLARWWRNRYRREALRRLRGIASQPFEQRLFAAHELLKIVSVYVYGREVIANLADTDWYKLLNASVDETVFTKEQQLFVHHALYRGQELNKTELNGYLGAIALWLQLHHLERDGD